MPTSTKPDHSLANRILRAAGVAPETVTVAAESSLARLIAKDKQDAKDRGVAETDPAELWTKHSAKNLVRFFAGRCISCSAWGHKDGDEGSCHVVSEAIGFKSPGTTTAVWGCTSYQDLPVEDGETIRARTELAFSLGLLPAYRAPDDPPVAVEEP